MRSSHRRAVLGVLAATAGCAHAGRSPAREFAGVTLVRAAELPALPGAQGTAGDGFERACAMRLRDPRNGRELLLVRSEISTPATAEGGVRATRLESAVGDYAPLTPDGRGREAGPPLRVDCVTGRAVGWAAPGA